MGSAVSFAIVFLMHLCAQTPADSSRRAAGAVECASDPGALARLHSEAVTVTAASSRPAQIGVSSEMAMGAAEIMALRDTAMGDPVRAAQALPGVAASEDFRAEFSVRGSAFRHVGLVIDGTVGTPLFHAVQAVDNPGSVAMVNADVLDRIALSAGPHARRHGDWMGATLEFDVREGSRHRPTMRAAMSGTSSSVVAEGPIDRTGRGSWLVAVRKSYMDWLIRKVEPDFDSAIGFWDGHAKVVYDLTPRHQVQALVIGGDAAYHAREAGTANGLLHASSGALLASVALRYTAPRVAVTQRISIVGNNFRNSGVLQQELARGYSQALVWRTDASVPLGHGWTFEGGGLVERRRMNEILRTFQLIGSERLRVTADRNVSPSTTLLGAWAHIARETSSGGIAAGTRVSTRTFANGEAVSPWLLVERRVGAMTLRASAGASAQFPDPKIVLTGNTPIRPETGHGVDVSFEHRMKASFSWQVTAFHRRESHVVRPDGEYRLHPSLSIGIPAARLPIVSQSLEGTARGVELLLLRRSAAGPNGWIGYTWAHAGMRDVLTGETFDADQDQRHTLNAVGIAPLSNRTSVSATLRVGSNVPLIGYFERTSDGGGLRLAAERNRVRLPLYARLDLRATRMLTTTPPITTLFVEVMNVTGRRNLGQVGGSIQSTLEATGFVERMIPLVPSVGLVVEF